MDKYIQIRLWYDKEFFPVLALVSWDGISKPLNFSNGKTVFVMRGGSLKLHLSLC